MLRYAKSDEISSLSALWDDCFPEDASFRDHFFANLFQSDTTVVCEQDGKPVGMAHFTLQDYDFQGISLPAAYVFGVGTHSAHRGQGVAGEVIRFLLNELRNRGVAVAFLVPNGAELFNFYTRFGFTTITYVEKSTFSRNEISPSDETIEPLSPSNAFDANDVYEKVLEFRSHLKRTPEFWRFTVAASYGWNGGAVCVRRGGAAVGYAVYAEGRIDELLAYDESAFNALRRGVLDIFGTDRAQMNAPACPRKAKRYGMARIVNAEMLLKYALEYREGDFSISLNDSLVPLNTRTYIVVNGVVSTDDFDETVYINPEDMARTILETSPAPYMNLIFSDD